MSKRTREHMSLAEGLQDFLGKSKLQKSKCGVKPGVAAVKNQ